MGKQGVSEKLKQYVEKGGILLVTYLTGYVNENCLCYQGGFPGDGLKDLLGVVSEEIDTLYPSDQNEIRFLPGKLENESWIVKDYAELLRVVDAEVLAEYVSDFYAGYPALTCKKSGEGKAYYQAARCKMEGMKGFLSELLKEAGIKAKSLPAGVEYHRRYDEDTVYEFYLNTSEEKITLSDAQGTNLVSGEEIDGQICLEPKENMILKMK